MEEIDKKINEAANRPLTAENLNYIGDLHLKKGEKNQAIDYFFTAADKLSFAQKDKKIAIYKKIINNSPSDDRAYEGIINILSEMGLTAEELRFLTILADLYQKKGEYNKINSIFRRIREIDPQNTIAEKYFQKGKQLPVEKNNYETDTTEEQEEVDTNDPADKEDIDDEEKEIVFKVKDRADVGIFTATLEEADTEEKPFYMPEPEKTYEKVYLYTGISILLIVVGAAFFMLKGKDNANLEKFWIDNKREITTANYEISTTRISDELIDESGILSVIDQDDIQKRQFYSVSVRALTGCLPDKFLSSPHSMIFLISKNGLFRKIEEINGLNKLNKIIYKSSSCNREFGAVFVRFVVYHNKDLNYTGLSIQGLERDYPVIIKWK